jgi:signal transduction histidine kinase/CheY-like chemotaxis protein
MMLLFFALVSAMFDRRFEAMALREANAVAGREAHLREVLTRMPLAVLVVARGQEEKVSFSNALAADLLGHVRHPADLVFTDIGGNDLPPDEQPFRAAIRAGAQFDHHLVGYRPPHGQSLRYLEIGAARLSSAGEAGEQVILTAQDVTARLEAEQALQQSQKLETIGHLTGGVAHDFNNLLTPIIGGLDLLRRDGTMSARAQRIVDGALQASTKAATLVQRLLAFSRRQVLQPKPLDMGAILHGLRDLIERSIGPTIAVTIDTEPGLVARIDPGQFELAILNLAVNARDAMPDGGRLTIGAAARVLDDPDAGLAAASYVRVTVADTGLGMDEATLKRAVEPFFSTKGIGKGTGLGLSMVHGLAGQSNGLLRLSSAPGKGTRAELWLPRIEEPAAAAAEEEAPPETNAEQSACILVVDDEDLVRGATAAMLREFGYHVVEASSGAAALRCLERERDIALVVTDHLMPGMTGATLAGEIGRDHPDKMVLIITGYANPEELPIDLPRLRKPFRADDLGRSVRDLLRFRGGGKVISLDSRRGGS